MKAVDIAVVTSFILSASVLAVFAAPSDLFERYRIPLVDGTEKIDPCGTSPIVTLSNLKLEEVAHSCVAAEPGGTDRERMVREMRLQDGYGAALHNAGWRSCGGLGNVLFFFDPKRDGDFITMIGLDEAWSSDLGGPSVPPRMVLVFLEATKAQIPFETCPPKMPTLEEATQPRP